MSFYEHHEWRRLGDRLATLAFCIATSKAMASGEDIRNTTNRLVAANKIERAYIDPLDLRGKSGAAAVEKMLAEGFRCRIEIAGEYVPGEQPMWYCTKRYSEEVPVCEELFVALRFGAPAESYETRDALLLSLERVKVTSSRASCEPPLPVSTAQVAARSVGEKSLADAINSLSLKEAGDIAYGQLLRDGFFCGFVAPDDSQDGPRMECTKSPSRIKFCHEAKLTIGMSWSDGVRKLQRAYGQLPKSRVASIRATCEFPPAQSKSGS